MEKIKVGLPRALMYYKFQTLWKEFFEQLNIEVIISPKTNKEIIDKGSNYVVDEACLSLKIFMGHVDYLQDKCDYILIPRISCLRPNEKLCTNFLALFDLVNNSFSKVKILNYQVDKEAKELEIDGFIKIGKELGFSYLKSLKAYKMAKQKEAKVYQNKMIIQKQQFQNNKLKIMLVAHPYNLYDEFIGKPIIDFLKKENIAVILSDIFDNSFAKVDCESISKTLYWTFNKELMAAINKYKNKVDGIILLSTFPCGPDSLANELIIRKVKNVPISYIIADNNSSDTGLLTRLESFIDIIRIKKERKLNNEEKACN